MNKTIKIVSTLLIVMMLLFTASTVVRATDYGSIIGNIDNADKGDTGSLQTMGAKIINIITTVGIIVAIIVLLILGIKYMMGSASEKAEYKKTMIPYIIGAVLIAGGSTIVKFVMNFNTIFTSTGA